MGSEAVLAKVSEVLFVEALRKYASQLSPGQVGWLAAARDPHVWTVESLAHDVGLSRSAFVARFSALLAMPPMEYLARLRLQMAARPRDHADQHAGHRSGGRLRIRSRVQSGIQTRTRRAAGPLPHAPQIRCSATGRACAWL